MIRPYRVQRRDAAGTWVDRPGCFSNLANALRVFGDLSRAYYGARLVDRRTGRTVAAYSGDATAFAQEAHRRRENR
jgi:hypothetical protein